MFTDRETATILAALRIYQWREDNEARHHLPDTVSIATDDHRFLPLTDTEIDDLCERINTEEN